MHEAISSRSQKLRKNFYFTACIVDKTKIFKHKNGKITLFFKAKNSITQKKNKLNFNIIIMLSIQYIQELLDHNNFLVVL